MTKKKENIINESISVSEEQLLKAMEVENLSEHYHSEDKGCDISTVTIEKKIGEEKRRVKADYCSTHCKVLCRCGWEIGYHYGTHSMSLPNSKETLKLNDKNYE